MPLLRAYTKTSSWLTVFWFLNSCDLVPYVSYLSSRLTLYRSCTLGMESIIKHSFFYLWSTTFIWFSCNRYLSNLLEWSSFYNIQFLSVFLINLVQILYHEQWHLYTPSVHSSQATVRGPKIDISAEPCPNKLIGDSPSVKGDSKQPLRCSSCSTGLSWLYQSILYYFVSSTSCQ